MTLRERARHAVDNIIADLRDRRGLRQEWDQIDDDIRNEIIQLWTDLVEKEMP